MHILARFPDIYKTPESVSHDGTPRPTLQRARSDYGNRVSPKIADSSPPDLDSIPSGGGQSLEASARAPLEQHFQADLRDVRVHTDPAAAESARSLDALAYTAGRDIYFAPGMYSPASHSGRRLLAHEVAHVVQQSSGKEPSIAAKSSRGVKIGAPEDMLEMEAERDAEEFMNGEPRRQSPGPVQGAAPVRAVQRQTPKPPSTTSLDATAQSIIDAAKDAKVGEDARATAAVLKIIQSYYSSKAANVNTVKFEKAVPGLETDTTPATSKPPKYNIYVGQNFLKGVQDAGSFAHRVLQAGHELEHIDQFSDSALGPSPGKKDEREFLAFSSEALATEIPHTGRLPHCTRIDIIDQALRYYNCLSSASEQDKKDAAKKHAARQQELLTRRSTEIKHECDPPKPADPPTDCKRERMSKKP